MTKTYLIVGASRGIGLEFVRQLLARGDQVIAAVRDPYKANDLYRLSDGIRPGALIIQQCDVTREDSIDVSTIVSFMYCYCSSLAGRDERGGRRGGWKQDRGRGWRGGAKGSRRRAGRWRFRTGDPGKGKPTQEGFKEQEWEQLLQTKPSKDGREFPRRSIDGRLNSATTPTSNSEKGAVSF